MDYSYYELMDMPNSEVPVKVLSSFFYGLNKGFISHWHEHTEILCSFNTKVEISCGNNTFEVGPEDIVFVNSSEMHSLKSLGSNLKYKVIICDLKKLLGKSRKSSENNFSELLSSNLVVFSNKIPNDIDCIETLNRLINEYETMPIGYEMEIKSLMLHFFTLLSRSHTKSILSLAEYKNKKITMGKISSIFAYIDINYPKVITSAGCADMLNFSHSHFCHAFRKVTGKTFIDYLNETRMIKSLAMLKETNLSITQIALETGFDDPGYYTRVFKNKIGITPTEYRGK